MLIREVAQPKFSDLTGRVISTGQGSGSERAEVLDSLIFTGSGKGAIALALKYLSKIEVLSNKLDEILMPDWLGYWVYNQVQPFAFPAKRFSERTRVLFVYHQYGFPQKMDEIMEFARSKKLIVIEDCAHAIAGSFEGKPLGSFGDFGIFSFSKWFFCYALGGVKSKFADFPDFAEREILAASRFLGFFKNTAKYLYEAGLSLEEKNFFAEFSRGLINMSYALYGSALKPGKISIALARAKIAGEIKIRQSRYQNFLSRTSHLGIGDALEKAGVTPYVIPVLCPSPKAEKLVAALAGNRVASGIYQFDVNRNLLSPKFVPCVWLPCHAGISDEVFDNMIKIVLTSL